MENEIKYCYVVSRGDFIEKVFQSEDDATKYVEPFNTDKHSRKREITKVEYIEIKH